MHKKLLLLMLAAFTLVACDRSPKDISDLKDATPADSMMFYFGTMQASIYWRDAETDTLLRSEKARQKFMEGFRAAMKMDEDDSAYNKGLQLGLRLALRLREFHQRYGEDFSEEILAASLENYLENDSDFDLAQAQKGYYRIKDQLEQEASLRELTEAKKQLAKCGKEKGYQMINDTLYALDVTPPSRGPKFKTGDRLAVEVTASTLDGKEIVTRQFPDSITLGEGRVPLIVRYAIFTMTNGQTRKFMTTPRTLLGKRYQLYHLPADKPIIFTVKAMQPNPEKAE